MSSFLDALNAATELDLQSGENTTYTYNPLICPELVPHEQFRLFLLIPSFICTIILAFTKRRSHKKQDCLNGRPGFIYPMDILGRSGRFSYAAAFGTLAHLCSAIVFEAKYAFTYTGPVYFKVFVALASMLIYGLGYFPLFAGISAQNPVGFFVATLYAWTFAIDYFGNLLNCPLGNAVQYVLALAQGLPEIICHIYLSISLPIRFFMSLCQRKRKLKMAVDFESSEDLYDSIKKSYQGIHVSKLFRKPPPPPKDPDGLKEKLINVLKSLSEMIFYKRMRGFRYSARMISVMVVGFVLLYSVTFQLFVLFYGFFEFWRMMVGGAIEDIGLVASADESPNIQSERDWLLLGYYIIIAFRACFLTSLMLAFAINAVFLLHYLSSYRNNLLSLYKGKPGHLTTKDEKSNASLMVGSMRYAGYQVGYIGWGFFLQFCVFLLISIVIATVVTLWPYIGDWLIDKFHAVWPVLLTTLVLNFVQLLLAKFLFLQEHGEIMAVDNRRLLFIFTYFMFFYNIFIGIVSCLVRILKSIILGALFLPRLDHSTLPRKFQQLDPGFDAYCGFMHVECAHTNPVAMVFISILQAESFNSLKRNSNKETDEFIDIKEEASRKKKAKARWKWRLSYTLVNNPELCIQRRLVLAKERNENVKEILLGSYAFPIDDKNSSYETKL